MVIKACMDSNKSNTHDGHIFNKVRIYCTSNLPFFLHLRMISSSDADKYHFCFVLSINLRTFAPEASRADTRKSGLANRAIALSHGGQGTMRKQHYSLQKQKRYATKYLLHQVCSAAR